MIIIPFQSLSFYRTCALFLTLASLCGAAEEGKTVIGAKPKPAIEAELAEFLA